MLYDICYWLFGSKLPITNGIFLGQNLEYFSAKHSRLKETEVLSESQLNDETAPKSSVFSSVFQLTGTNTNKDRSLLAKTNKFFRCRLINKAGSELQQFRGRNTNSSQKKKRKKSGKQETDGKLKTQSDFLSNSQSRGRKRPKMLPKNWRFLISAPVSSFSSSQEEYLSAGRQKEGHCELFEVF